MIEMIHRPCRDIELVPSPGMHIHCNRIDLRMTLITPIAPYIQPPKSSPRQGPTHPRAMNGIALDLPVSPEPENQNQLPILSTTADLATQTTKTHVNVTLNAFAPKGNPAMKTMASPTCLTSNMGSGFLEPSGWVAEDAVPAPISVAALPVGPSAMRRWSGVSYERERERDGEGKKGEKAGTYRYPIDNRRYRTFSRPTR